jgi:mannose-6-phosphate isomerase
VGGLLGARPGASGPAGTTRLLPRAADEFFRVERVETAAGPASFAPQVAVLVVLAGEGRLAWGDGELPAGRGTTLLVPFGAGATRIEGEVSVLRCMPPAP